MKQLRRPVRTQPSEVPDCLRTCIELLNDPDAILDWRDIAECIDASRTHCGLTVDLMAQQGFQTLGYPTSAQFRYGEAHLLKALEHARRRNLVSTRAALEAALTSLETVAHPIAS